MLTFTLAIDQINAIDELFFLWLPLRRQQQEASMFVEGNGMNFEWAGTACEIHLSKDVGYILEVRQWWKGRYGYVIDKVHPYDNDIADITIGQWHAPTESEARKAAEQAFLRHLGGGPVMVQ